MVTKALDRHAATRLAMTVMEWKRNLFRLCERQRARSNPDYPPSRYYEKTADRGGSGNKGIGSPCCYTARDDGDGMETQPFSSLRAPTSAKQSRPSPFPLL